MSRRVLLVDCAPVAAAVLREIAKTHEVVAVVQDELIVKPKSVPKPAKKNRRLKDGRTHPWYAEQRLSDKNEKAERVIPRRHGLVRGRS